MGSSSAFHIASRDPTKRVCVIERDPGYSKCSSTLSVGGIRQQFSMAENIQLSQYSYKFFTEVSKHLTVDPADPADIHLRRGAYVMLASKEGVSTLMENYKLQRDLGCHIKLLDNHGLHKRYPWMNTDDIKLGSVGFDCEGCFDPWALLSSFKKKSISLGVQYIHAEATGMMVSDDKIAGIQIAPSSQPDARYTLRCDTVVNCAGPWAGRIARQAGIDLPVEPRKRYVFVFKCPDQPIRENTLFVDRTGVYFRPEPQGYICGLSPNEDEEPDVADLEVDYDFFTEKIWPVLAHRVPAFECIKIQGAWAGYYDYNVLDQNAVIGRHPKLSNMIFATGFSGHGIQQSPAVGRAVSELILDQEFTTIDLRNMGYERVINNAPIREKNIV
ncbi:predicted protein [Nematostella vectensis]|uniref:FAD-dependent oxidoreductase domain-containing protein 1 n=2 Tax=Nematostella vectensis TaxID=45351 RepID=A7T8B3_NEMVE|nr:predicted protein [Nematostella vectensis]|eukprot:XP_001619878.1 hypothetical protein NEMVEDRAFT_v1g195930 [Nematostella vectensis]